MLDAFQRERTVRVGDIETLVGETGDGPPVVFLHGNPDSHTVWSGVAARLAGKFRCIAPDLPGFGRTSLPAEFSYSLFEQAGWVKGVFDALELPRAHLVIHDVGGVFGCAFAADHGDRLLSLTIGNTLFFPDYKWHFWARVWRTRGLGELSWTLLNRPLFRRELRRGSPHISREYADHAYVGFTKSVHRAVLRWYRAMDPSVFAGWDKKYEDAVARLPHGVIWGDRDPFIPARFAERFGKNVQHFPDLGHWWMVEDPEAGARAIEGILRA
jgi:pimeloyl-ACP methyl ester carboxylesterase